MKCIRIIAVVGALSLSSACASSKYAVVPSAEKELQNIELNGVPLVSVKKDGSWLWYKSPEEVVQALSHVAGQLDQLLFSCQADLKKYAPKTPDVKTAKAAK